MGYQALYANTTGFYNTAMSYALLSNTTGSYNTAVGFVALFYSTTGSFNTAIGSNALNTNTTGYGNSAVGNYALNFNRLGSGNSVFGYNAGYGVNNVTNITASSTIIGAYAGFSMGSTTANILIGYGAGYSLAGGSILSGSGSNNIVIGYNTDLPSTTQNSTLDIANLIYATGLTNFTAPSTATSTGNIGIGFVKGFGLKRGALASSIAHDSHNIIAVGVDDADIFCAVNSVISSGGGLAIADRGRVIDILKLPVAGLMSDMKAEDVAAELVALGRIAKGLGSTINEPFQVLSFLALPVIPELKLTDLGLVDVRKMRHVDLCSQ